MGLDFRGDIPATRRARVYSQGSKITEATESSTALTNSDQDLVLGALNTNYGNYLGADYGELVHFSFSLDTTEHILIQNYLASKFGIALTANDIYRGDDVANGDHDFDVAGIGRVNANSIHDDARGTGIIRILNPTDLDNNEFMIWGHDNGNPSAVETTDVPAGVDARLDRQWYVTETNASGAAVDVGAVDIRFDLRSYTTNTVASDLRLLIDSDADGNFSDEAAISGASLISGSVYAFTGVTALTNGTTFTLGTADSSQTPLPVELLFFTAKPMDGGVVLKWSTASEVNHAFFALERSTDVEHWTTIATIQGNGDHVNTRAYEYRDLLESGVYFYRLQQVDLDGRIEFSEVVRIEVETTVTMNSLVYPNPARDRLYISNDALIGGWQLTSLDGVSQEGRLRLIEQTSEYHVFSLEGMSEGYYVFRNRSGEAIKVCIQP